MKSKTRARAQPAPRCAIVEADVPRIFDDDFIDQLANTVDWARFGAALSPTNKQKRRRFKERIQEAALNFIPANRATDDNNLHREINELLHAALRWLQARNDKNLHRVIRQLEKLSSPAREWLEGRARGIASVAAYTPRDVTPQTFMGRGGEILSRKRIQPRAIALPVLDDLRDDARRVNACDDIVTLCLLKVQVEGRKRKFMPFAPPLLVHPKKREAEVNFVDALRSAWLEATGEPASWTANPGRPGPFVRMAGKCLMLLITGKPAKLEPHQDQKFYQTACARIIAIYERRRQAEDKIKLQSKRWALEILDGVPHGLTEEAVLNHELEDNALADLVGAGLATVVTETPIVDGPKVKRWVITDAGRTIMKYLRNFPNALSSPDTNGLYLHNSSSNHITSAS